MKKTLTDYYFKRSIQAGRSCSPSPSFGRWAGWGPDLSNIPHRLQALISGNCTVPTPDSGRISSLRGSAKLLTHWAEPKNKLPWRMAMLLAQNLLWGPYLLVCLRHLLVNPSCMGVSPVAVQKRQKGALTFGCPWYEHPNPECLKQPRRF